MQTDAQRLEAVEVALRRWHTRLTRATNAIRKLEAKRRRLSGPTRPKTMADRDTRKVERHRVVQESIPLPELDAFFQPEPKRPRGSVAIADLCGPKGGEALATAARESAEDAGIPAFLDRRDPLIAEQMTKARKAKEADARKAMPLTGKAALAKIRSKK